MKMILIIYSLLNYSLFSQAHEDDHSFKITSTLFEEIGITFTNLQKRILKDPIIVHGEIIPTNSAYLKVGSLLSGRVEKIHVLLGQRVKKGDVLFEISSLEVMELMDSYFSSEAELKRAKATYERLISLRKDGIGSDKAFFEAESDYEKNKAQFESRDRKIHAIGLSDKEIKNLSENKKHHSANMPIKAGISGVITQLLVRKGEYISGENTLAEIIDSEHVWARLHVYEKDFFNIGKNSRVEIRSSIDPQRKSFGKIIAKSPSFMKTKKSIEFISSVENSKKFIIFSNIDASIFPQSRTFSWVLPNQSIVQLKGENYVFVRKSKNQFERRKVIVAQKTKNFIEILSGLSANESVVEKGTFYLKSLASGGDIGGHGH